MALHTIVEHDTTHIKPYIDKVKQALNNEAEARATLGAHNLVNILDLTAIQSLTDNVHSTASWNGTAFSWRGITFTLSESGVDVNGTGESSGSYITIPVNLKNGVTYRVSGVTSTDNCALSIKDGANTTLATLTKDSETFVATSNNPHTISVITSKELTYNHTKVYPMITLATDAATTYHPYAKTNKELTDITDNLIATENDNAPYVFRKGLGSLVDFDMVGGTVAWNQLIPNGNFATQGTWTPTRCTVSEANNKATLTCNQDGWMRVYEPISVAPNHVCLISAGMKFSDNSSSKEYALGFIVDSESQTIPVSTTYNQFGIIKRSSNASGGVWFGTKNAVSGDILELSNCNCFDLTQMFGTTIADYIYSLEQATAGAGVAWFRQYFSKAYYAYNAGQLLSVKPSGRKVVGFNQWDEQWEVGGYSVSGAPYTDSNLIRSKNHIPVIKGTYFFSANTTSGIRVCGYDANKNFIDVCPLNNQLFDVLEGMSYIRFHVTKAVGDICINLSDPSKNGTYEPYDSTEYTFSQTDLRGLFKLDANNKLYADGDVYKADGKIARKYGVVDLGTQNWTREENTSIAGTYLFRCLLSPLPKSGSTCICSKYVYIKGLENMTASYITVSGEGQYTYIRIRDDSYTDAATFKTAMSGVYLVYELATPTTENAPVFVNPQRSFANGTEEWLDERDVTIPVGNNSIYYQNDTYPAVTAYADGLYDVLEENKAERKDLASISITGTTNNTGSAITAGTYFYLNGTLVRAKVGIANNATFTLNTNYEVVTAGALNDVNSKYVHYESTTIASNGTKTITLPRSNEAYQIMIGSANGAVWGYAGVAFTSTQNPSVVELSNTASNINVTISGTTLTIENADSQYAFSGIIKII